MVEVFKTNVQQRELAGYLTSELLVHFPQYKINFDLEDCDRILRVEGNQVRAEKIIELIKANGFQCWTLE